MTQDKPLAGKVAVVTGSSRGLGREMAVCLAQLGAKVVVTARTVEPRDDVPGTIHETAALVRETGQECLPVAADLSSPRDIAAMAEQTLEAFGRIDVLVNSAGALDERMWEDFWEMTPESWLYQVGLNLNAIWLTAKAFVPVMREQGDGGLVVSMCSGGYPGTPPNTNLPGKGATGAAYLTTKRALDQLIWDLSKEFRPFGIGMVGIHPGLTRTNNNKEFLAMGGFDWAKGHKVDVPVSTLRKVVTSHDPLEHTGRVIFAPDFVREHGLVSDDVFAPA